MLNANNLLQDLNPDQFPSTMTITLPLYLYIVSRTTVVEGDPKDPFSEATTQREGSTPFPGSITLPFFPTL